MAYYYTYRQLESDVGAKVGACLGITLDGVWPLANEREVLLEVPAQLSISNKALLDDFMTSRNFIFISEAAVVVPPAWPSDPIIPP